MPAVPRMTGAVAALLALTACGGGGGGSGGGSAPVELGAALPDVAGVSFAASAITASEASRHVPVSVVRTGPGTGRTVVAWRLREIDARVGADLATGEGRLEWADGETGARTIDLLVHSDDLVEVDERVEVVLEALEGDRPLVDALTLTLEDAACSGELPPVIERDTALDRPCYRMPTSVTVGGGAQLSFAAGSTVIAQAGRRLDVLDDALIIADGTPHRPVSLVGANRVSGYWQGVRIASRSPLQQFAHVHVADATIGIDVIAGSTLTRLDGGLLDNTSIAAARVPLDSAELFDAGTAITRSAGGVELIDTQLASGDAARLPALDGHWSLAQDLLVAGALTLDAGVELRFSQDRRLALDSRGTLSAIGTADAPIVLGGIEAVPGHWRGVQLYDSSGENRLRHVRIADAGRDAARDGALSISGASTWLSAQHLTFATSAGVGLWLDRALPAVQLDALSFDGNALGEVRRDGQVADYAPLAP